MVILQESRKLKEDENPLLVQLNWIKDDREGRFLLKNEDDERPVSTEMGTCLVVQR